MRGNAKVRRHNGQGPCFFLCNTHSMEGPRKPGVGHQWKHTLAEELQIGDEIRKGQDKTIEPPSPTGINTPYSTSFSMWADVMCILPPGDRPGTGARSTPCVLTRNAALEGTSLYKQ